MTRGAGVKLIKICIKTPILEDSVEIFAVIIRILATR